MYNFNQELSILTNKNKEWSIEYEFNWLNQFIELNVLFVNLEGDYNNSEIDMRAVTFISHKETLKEALEQINPKFSTLASIIP